MDFQQGLITTIHEYGVTEESLIDLRKGLERRPTALLIPCLFDEFKRPALKTIRDVLSNLKGLNKIVIALSANSIEEAREAKSFFASISLVWVSTFDIDWLSLLPLGITFFSLIVEATGPTFDS